MQVFIRMPSGKVLTVDHVSGDDAVQKLMERIYDQDGDAHPELQRLAFGHDEISQTRSRTLAACGVVHKSDLNLGLWPPAMAITLLVGAVKHITTLETLLSNRESCLYDMFVGVPAGQPPCFPTNAGGGAVGPDGVREARALRPRLGGPLPKDAETGWYMIDRNGESFHFILDYLRCGGEVALPPPGQQRQQLAIEARYFGLPELAAMCTVDSVASLAAACGDGITAAEILELPREQLQPLCAEQGVSVIFAARIRAEIDAEHARLAADRPLRLGFCVGNAQGQGTATFVSQDGQWATAVGGEPLDPSRGAVFWKATVAQCQQYHLMIGVIGNPQPAADSRSDPTHFSWDAGYNYSWAGGQYAENQGGYTSFAQGDVLIFKLEARQLSLRVARLGAQTFTLNTNGVQGLRTCVCAHHPSRVEFSAAQPGEEY